MIKTLMDVMLTNSAVSFVRQGDNITISVRTGSVVAASNFSLEELYKLAMGDEDAANYILSEAIEGLYNETKFKRDRDAKLLEKLTFHLDAIAKRECAEANLKEENE